MGSNQLAATAEHDQSGLFSPGTGLQLRNELFGFSKETERLRNLDPGASSSVIISKRLGPAIQMSRHMFSADRRKLKGDVDADCAT
jgi:hypothetical protein